MKIKRLFGADQTEDRATRLYSPTSGKVVPLNEVKDETFSSGILGEGVAIEPSGNVLLAPTDATVSQVFDSGHAMTLLTDGGAELLLHIGIDTVALRGKHFLCSLRTGERVKRGDMLIRFDGAAIREAGYELTTPMVVCNSDEFDIRVIAQGEIDQLQPLMEFVRKGDKRERI
jgi:glucose-specific phosphotransferase system IIA component